MLAATDFDDVAVGQDLRITLDRLVVVHCYGPDVVGRKSGSKFHECEFASAQPQPRNVERRRHLIHYNYSKIGMSTYLGGLRGKRY